MKIRVTALTGIKPVLHNGIQIELDVEIAEGAMIDAMLDFFSLKNGDFDHKKYERWLKIVES